jgi:hypothetical protein
MGKDQPLNGERIRRTSSRLEPLNPLGTRSTASPSLDLQLGTQWNASLPVPAGRFMGRAGVRGEKIEKRPISRADLQEDRPHLTLLSPLPPGAEREDGRAFVVHPTVCSVSPKTEVVPAKHAKGRENEEVTKESWSGRSVIGTVGHNRFLLLASYGVLGGQHRSSSSRSSLPATCYRTQ